MSMAISKTEVYKREEHLTMKSGKFDVEPGRMSEIVASVRANSLVPFNESFAATMEWEGSEINDHTH